MSDVSGLHQGSVRLFDEFHFVESSTQNQSFHFRFVQFTPMLDVDH